MKKFFILATYVVASLFATKAWAEAPAEAPTAPTFAENHVKALFSATYQTNTLNFTPKMPDDGVGFSEETYPNGQKIFYKESFGWVGFGNWDATPYDLSAYEAFYIDIWVTVDSKIKITMADIQNADVFKDGIIVDLKANQWNNFKVDLLDVPYNIYNFKTFNCLILEGFTNEGTPLAVANAYFYSENEVSSAVENVSVQGQPAVKKIVKGQLVIEKDGKRYNALGVEL